MKILVCLDLSDSTEKIISMIEQYAKATSANLWLLHIAMPDPDFIGYESGPQTERDFIASKFHEEHKQLQVISDRLRSHGLDTTALLVQGSTVETILEEARKMGADIIVTGSHGHGLMYDLLVGSVSEGILQHAECPVLVVPTHHRS